MRFDKFASAMILFMICAMIALSGCSPGSSQGEEQNQQAMVAQEKQASATTQPAAETQVEQVKADTTTVVQEPMKTVEKSLKDLLSVKAAKYTADYDQTAQGMTFKMTITQDLPKMAVSSTVKGTETKSVIDGDKIYVCSKTGSAWQCFEQKLESNEQEKLESDIKDGKAESLYIGTCSIAGETGSEYEVTSNNEESTLCYTSDGIVLKMATKATSMIATKVVRSVASDAFDLPAEPQDMAALQEQYAGMIPR